MLNKQLSQSYLLHYCLYDAGEKECLEPGKLVDSESRPLFLLVSGDNSSSGFRADRDDVTLPHGH